LSRIDRAKRIELAIEAFSSEILRDKKLFIIGYVSKDNEHYYYKLTDLCKNHSNISIFPNLKRAELLGLLSKAKVFFHPRPNEHFGISTVEAMAAGCLPVVHGSRGPLEVIVNNGKYGLAYTDAKELPHILYDAFNSAKHFQHKLRSRALDFDTKRFNKKFETIIYKTTDDNGSMDKL
jgi:glycosyltransferase involved in cell wall biosynthesis